MAAQVWPENRTLAYDAEVFRDIANLGDIDEWSWEKHGAMVFLLSFHNFEVKLHMTPGILEYEVPEGLVGWREEGNVR